MQCCPLRRLLHIMQSCPGLCKNRPADMYVTVRVSERACTEPTYSMNIHVFYDCSGWPNISHVIHDMHLACKKKWWTCSVDQGRLIHCKDGFARGGHNCICKCVRVDTIALCSSVRTDSIAYAKPSGGHYCICNTVLRIVLHRGHNCMRHRYVFMYLYLHLHVGINGSFWTVARKTQYYVWLWKDQNHMLWRVLSKSIRI